MNRVNMVGRITKDPELRYLQPSGTASTKVTIAVDDYNHKTKEKEAQFFQVSVIGKSAENLVKYMGKGGLISVSGKLRQYSYQNKEGAKIYGVEIQADFNDGVRYLSKPSNQGANNDNSFAQNSQRNNYVENNNNPNDSFAGGSVAPNDPFGSAFDFGGDMTPVDDGDMPF